MLLFVLGDITQKGYEKKRTRLLTPYIPQQQPQGKFNFHTLTIKRNIAANTDAWTNKVPYQTHQYWHVFSQWRHVFHNYSTEASKAATEASPGSSVNWSPSMDVGQSRNYRDGPARFRNEGQTVRPSWIWTPDYTYLERQYDEPLIHLPASKYYTWTAFTTLITAVFVYKHKCAASQVFTSS